MATRDSRYRSGRDLWSLGLLPLLLGGSLAGLVGIYWDIAWHIDVGRDTFFTPPHNFLYANILAVLLAALWGIWRDRRDSPFHLRLGRLRLHAGLLVVALGAALLLLFAPLDELWHRLFGVDVALWAPMHLVGLLAFGIAGFGGVASAWLESVICDGDRRKLLFRRVTVAFCALLLAWAMLLLAEFEYSVLQFPVILHPLLLAPLSTLVLVFALRLSPVPYAASWTAAGFTVLRLTIAGVLMLTAELGLAGQSRPLVPLLLPVGVALDLLARRKLPSWVLGAGAGLLTLLVNAPLVMLGDGIQWPASTLLIALTPALALSALAGALADWTAGALRGRRLTKRAGPAHLVRSGA